MTTPKQPSRDEFDDLKEQVREMQERQALMHRALFEAPASAPTQKPLIERVGAVVIAVERSMWLLKSISWGLPTIAGLGVAFQTVVKWFGSSGGQ